MNNIFLEKDLELLDVKNLYKKKIQNINYWLNKLLVHIYRIC